MMVLDQDGCNVYEFHGCLLGMNEKDDYCVYITHKDGNNYEVFSSDKHEACLQIVERMLYNSKFNEPVMAINKWYNRDGRIER